MAASTARARKHEEVVPREASAMGLSALVPSRLPDLDIRLLVYPFLRDECDPHAPTIVDKQHSAELGPGKLVVVYPDRRLTILAFINQASQNVTDRNPLPR